MDEDDATSFQQDRFGRYEIGGRLGQGGMADVYDAYDPQHDRRVALKVLQAEWRREPEALRHFLREARAAGGLSDPRIVTIYDSGGDPAPFIAMELIEGPTLAEVLRHDGKLALPEALRLVRDLARALAYAHGRGRIHRDVKPSNILLVGTGREPKLADFGIAALAAEVTQRTRHDHSPGTPRYMAPEQWRGEPADARGDLFSLGVTFYEMLTGRRAFAADSAAGLGYQVTHEEPPPLRELAPEVPPSIAAIAARLMAKRPEDRFQTAEELLTALDVTAGGAPRRARKAAVLVAAGSLLAAAGAGSWWWWLTPPNLPPVARSTERLIEAGQVMEVDLGRLVSDPDGDRLALAAELPAGAPGRLELAGTRARYDPGASLTRLLRGESRSVRIRYRVDDGQGHTSEAGIEVRVLGTAIPNRPPEAVPDRAQTLAGRPVVLDVLANDRDPDTGDELRLVGAELAPGSPGALRLVEGRVAYDPGPVATPLPAERRTAEVRYAIVDGGGAAGEGRAWIDVEPLSALLTAPEPPSLAPPAAARLAPKAPPADERRCRLVMERFQLGGTLSDEDRALLQGRCQP